MRHRQRSQRLGRHLPTVAEHGQLAAPRADHLAVDADDVADIDVGFPFLQRFLADAGQAEHCLQLGAVAFLERGEAQLA